MREIKFRAWHDERKIMFPHWSIWKTDLFHYEEAACLHLMQFTGLKDRNGKEIYEGDIVKYSEHYFGDHKENECIEVVEWDEKEASYPCKLTSTGFADGPNWCEVMGNIYENPELLKGEQ